MNSNTKGKESNATYLSQIVTKKITTFKHYFWKRQLFLKKKAIRVKINWKFSFTFRQFENFWQDAEMKGGFKLLWIIWSDDLIWFGLIINDLIWYNIFFLQEDFQSSMRMNILITAERWKIKEHIFSLVPIFPWKLLPSFSSQKGENPNMDPQKSPHINSEKTFHFVHFLTRYYLNSSLGSNFLLFMKIWR